MDGYEVCTLQYERTFVTNVRVCNNTTTHPYNVQQHAGSKY